jgi:L-threonylcarbamoyladenylate synthase
MPPFEELDVAGRVVGRGELAGLAEFLTRGGVLAHPTSTVYGLGGILGTGVEESVARLKGRPARDFPLIRVAADVETLRRALPGVRWDDRAERIAAAFWPGPVTLILPDDTPRGVAVRVEGQPTLRRLLRELGEPISSTSLNAAGAHPAATAREARRALAGMPEVDAPILFLSAGDLPGAPPSSLVSLLGREVRIQREGIVPAERILACLDGESSE